MTTLFTRLAEDMQVMVNAHIMNRPLEKISSAIHSLKEKINAFLVKAAIAGIIALFIIFAISQL